MLHNLQVDGRLPPPISLVRYFAASNIYALLQPACFQDLTPYRLIMPFEIYIPSNLTFQDYVAICQCARTLADGYDRKVRPQPNHIYVHTDVLRILSVCELPSRPI